MYVSRWSWAMRVNGMNLGVNLTNAWLAMPATATALFVIEGRLEKSW